MTTARSLNCLGIPQRHTSSTNAYRPHSTCCQRMAATGRAVLTSFLPSYLRCSWILVWATAAPGGAGHPGRRSLMYALLPRSSTVEVAASPPAVRLWPKPALQLHQTPDSRAVGADVGLDVGGDLLEGGRVDAEQFRAPLQRRCDRPAQIWVVPSPHRHRLSNLCSRANRQCSVVQPSRSESERAACRRTGQTYGQQRDIRGDSDVTPVASSHCYCGEGALASSREPQPLVGRLPPGSVCRP
jgi:hypothetical protein